MTKMKRLVGQARIDKARALLRAAQRLSEAQGYRLTFCDGTSHPGALVGRTELVLATYYRDLDKLQPAVRERVLHERFARGLDVWHGQKKVLLLHWTGQLELRVVTWRRGPWEDELLAAAEALGPVTPRDAAPDVAAISA